MTTVTTAQALFTPAQIRTASLYPLATLEARTAGTARVLVTRYWPRGVKRDAVDYWLPTLAPSRGLLKAYKNGIPWETFATCYRAEMMMPPHNTLTSGEINVLDFISERHSALTLLCVEHCPRDGQDEHDVRCHRRLLRELLLNGEDTQP